MRTITLYVGTRMFATLQTVFAQQYNQEHVVEVIKDNDEHIHFFAELLSSPDYLSKVNDFIITTPYRMGKKKRYHYYFKNDVYSGSLFDDPSMNAYTRKPFNLPCKIHSQAQLRLRNKAPPERV